MVKGLVLSAILTTGLNVFAASWAQPVFLENGKSVSAEQGILDAAGGAQVLKCVPVEAKLSKSGTSVSLRNVKKPKSPADIDAAIEELKKQKASQ